MIRIRICFILLLLVLFTIICLNTSVVDASCADRNYCNGHGSCTVSGTCLCSDGWGSPRDIADFKSNDCALRVCPAGKAWADVSDIEGDVHRVTECSGRGSCNRKTGMCECYTGFAGNACQRTKCPNDCSGHGMCKSMRRMASESAAFPTSNNTKYGTEVFAFTYGDTRNDSNWDADIIFGCVCDSSWPVGLEAGQVQLSEFFGPDCSLRHCPSADNPYTAVNELDCGKKLPPYGKIRGRRGNICHVDCANLGKCDYHTGICHCFKGQFGVACEISENLVPLPPPTPIIDDDF